MQIVAQDNIKLTDDIDWFSSDGIVSLNNEFTNIFKKYNLESVFSSTVSEDGNSIIIKNVNVNFCMSISIEKYSNDYLYLVPKYTSGSMVSDRSVSYQSAYLTSNKYINMHIVCVDDTLQYISLHMYSSVNYSNVSSFATFETNCFSYGYLKDVNDEIYELSKNLSNETENGTHNVGPYMITSYYDDYLDNYSYSNISKDEGMCSLLKLKIYYTTKYNNYNIFVKSEVKNMFFVQGDTLIINNIYIINDDRYIAVYPNVLCKLI